MAVPKTLQPLTHVSLGGRSSGYGLLAGLAILSGCTVLSGCTGEIGGESGPDGPPGPPEVEPVVVAASPELVTSSGYCVALSEGEQLVSVSPEGHAWLAAPSATGARLRVLDAFDASAELVEDIAITELSQVQAWSEGDGAVLGAGGLWRLEDLARIQLTTPEGFSTPARFCGDPGSNGFLLSQGTLFERRDDAQWWGWDTGASGEAMPSALLRIEGECQDEHNVTWMTSADGTLWRVEPTQYEQPVKFEAAMKAAVAGELLAVLESDRLWLGPEWQPYVFEGTTPTALSAAGGQVWMIAGQQLLRTDGTSFVEVSHALGAPLEALAAHAGGVWVVGGGQVCHQATAPMARVQGIRPYARSKEYIYPFSVVASEAAMDVSATLDGEPIDLTMDAETGWYEGEARLDQVGWHAIELLVSGGGRVGERALMIKRLPEEERSWAVDIEPIYAASCAGSSCHQAGVDNPPDISSYQAWVERAALIQTRVVDAQTMPPPGNTSADWGEDDIAIIAQWLQGGMLP